MRLVLFQQRVKMKGNPIDLYQILENSDGNIPVYMTCGDKDFIYESDVKFVEAMKEKRNEC